MRIATWNINSVRLRLPTVLRFLQEQAPDVLCLQETKTEDKTFPAEVLKDAGYVHQAIRGMKSYNGVAVISRVPFTDEGQRDWCGKSDCRHLAVKLDGGPEVHNFYVPAGGDEPDPAVNDKFAHKLDFLSEMQNWFGAERKSSDPMVLVGDLNIAPLEHDVWSHKQLLKVVSHTPIEVEELDKLQSGLGWVDAVRHFVPETEKLYSWWSYRSKNWELADKGRRLDHVWVTEPLKSRLKSAAVVKSMRGVEKPSDHAPVIVDLD
ncbi:exodeoxyribonuclease III [Nisaea sp.]|uniref:exodeoxyribonuclease III n=1 Tax=Nisaea sp. TaxID=2024842 RepID=UPI003264EE84